MNTIKEQTQQERRAMYMKLTKQELVELLIANQDVIQHLIKPPLHISTYIPYPQPWPIDPSPVWRGERLFYTTGTEIEITE